MGCILFLSVFFLIIMLLYLYNVLLLCFDMIVKRMNLFLCLFFRNNVIVFVQCAFIKFFFYKIFE